jgi:hypothetical protein
VERLWVPLIQVHVARHWNSAASGASLKASLAPSKAPTFTPFKNGPSVIDMAVLLVSLSLCACRTTDRHTVVAGGLVALGDCALVQSGR